MADAPATSAGRPPGGVVASKRGAGRALGTAGRCCLRVRGPSASAAGWAQKMYVVTLYRFQLFKFLELCASVCSSVRRRAAKPCLLKTLQSSPQRHGATQHRAAQ